jgi:hypothetical protein
VSRSGGAAQINQFSVNVPAGSQSISVNLSTPDASAMNKFTYYLVSPALTSPTNTTSSCTPPACQSVTEPQTVNGQLVNNGTLTVNNPAAGLWQVDVSLTRTESGKEFTQNVAGTATVVPSTTVGGTVSSTLAVSVGSTAPSFGTFAPGVPQNYMATVGATVTSTAATSTLTVSDPDTTHPGHLVNTAAAGGPYALTQGLQVDATSTNSSATGGGSYTDLSKTNPATVLSYNAPVSNDPVTIGFMQPIAATDPLRTGSYTKTVTITLSTTTP